MRIARILVLLAAIPLYAQSEAELNKQGYELLAKKQIEEAIAVFARNVKEHPQSANAYDSLAEAYATAGKRWTAIAMYRRALSLQPSNEYEFVTLRKLGASITDDEWAHLFRPLIPANVEYTPNVTYRVIDERALRLHLLRPKSQARKTTLIFVHGGGWSEGTKERGIVPLLHFVKLGYVGIAIDYRLSDTALFPAQIDDVKAAIAFVRTHARDYGVDPKRIVVWGQSAGGHLAALAGTMGAADAVIDWNGPTDFTQDTATNPEDSAIYRLFGGHPTKENAAAADPVTYVSRGDPPFLILHGDEDQTVPIGDSERLATALKNAGVDVEFQVVPGANHFGLGDVTDQPPERNARIVDAMERFLRRLSGD
jgi:acetyl esterase/lipase